ncbi:MAG: DUF3232 domain-containing protein [Lachnospiraceae bacterium]|nr:DUF3232 domain-containing protein [Candidatus Colinaster equi]
MMTYASYLANAGANVLPIEEAVTLYEEMMDSIKQCPSADTEELTNEMLIKAIKYTKVRLDWELMSFDEKMAADHSRTMCHNAYIDSLNILARYLNKSGADTGWRDKLGDERKRIGDFACFISYVTGICNR